jgi:hypothetical protein
LPPTSASEWACTQLGWARLLLAANRRDEALPRLAAARAIATRSAMQPLLALIEALETSAT